MGARKGERGTLSKSTRPGTDRQEIPGCSQEDMVPQSQLEIPHALSLKLLKQSSERKTTF